MPVKMRIIQTYDPAQEENFMKLEQQFAELETRIENFPKGVRYKPIASDLPTHTLIWEGTFETLDQARAALDFFDGDEEHEALAIQQRPFFKNIRVEFLEEL